MAKQEGATEKATPHARSKARKKGHIAKSKSLTLFFSLLALYVIIKLRGKWFVDQLVQINFKVYEMVKKDVNYHEFTLTLISEMAKILLPIAIIVLIFIFIDHFIQIRFVLATEAFKPDMKRFNPIDNYFKRIISRKSWFELAKSFFILALLSFIVYLAFRNDIELFVESIYLPWNDSIRMLMKLFEGVLLKVIIGYFAIAVFDYFFQKMEYEEEMKMKRQDVKREHKDMEGSPEVKQQQKEMMKAIIENKLVEKIPESQVIITNPTHYAVAIKWDGTVNPKVVAKGIDHLALFIKELGEKNNIPIVQNPPYARELYQRVVENEEIPEDMWKVLTDILKVLYEKGQLKMSNQK